METKTIEEKLMGPNYSREGIFIYHNCWKCQNGKLPCTQPKPCEYPQARND